MNLRRIGVIMSVMRNGRIPGRIMLGAVFILLAVLTITVLSQYNAYREEEKTLSLVESRIRHELRRAKMK